jgi:hypothetical protein
MVVSSPRHHALAYMKYPATGSFRQPTTSSAIAWPRPAIIISHLAVERFFPFSHPVAQAWP